MLKFDDNFVCQNIISLWELKVCYFDSHRWVIEVIGAPGTLYANETYKLQVDFPEHYPMEAPQVVNF
jgi:ubiquitin-protein ligase